MSITICDRCGIHYHGDGKGWIVTDKGFLICDMCHLALILSKR